MKSIIKYFSDIFGALSSLWAGMRVTGKYFVSPGAIVTQQYPENRATLKMEERFKGEIIMPHDANNLHACTGCGICEINCPNGSFEGAGFWSGIRTCRFRQEQPYQSFKPAGLIAQKGDKKMSFNVIMFYMFSAIILVFSLLSITTRRILRAAVYLLFVLMATAGLYFLLQYQFIAAVQLTLYAGGIVVLIIFSILLTHHISHLFDHPDTIKLIMGIGVAVVGSGITIATILDYPFPNSTVTEMPATMENIGNQLLGMGKNGYVLPFELISVLLLAAMVAAIIVAKKEKNKNSEI